MEIKEQIGNEIKNYIKLFDEYDNDSKKEIEKMEMEHKQRIEKFDEKWGDDIFPIDLPIVAQEEDVLRTEKKEIEDKKKKLETNIKDSESNLSESVSKWENRLVTRRNELVEYGNNKKKYLQEKGRLEKELESQVEGIRVWERNGVDQNDSVYRRRKDKVIPELKKQIKDIDLKLDENKIREEYKQLGNLYKKIQEVKLHDRKHILPELADIFEVDKDEPVKTEPAKAEPVKTEPVKTEPVKTEPVKTEPVKTEPAKPQPAKTEPAKQQPAKTEPTKQQPAKTQPAKTEPTKQQPAKTEPAKSETVEPEHKKNNKEPLAKILIGRKIKIKYADGKTIPVVKSKEYFKYLKESKDPEFRIKNQLRRRLKIEKLDEKDPLDNIDSFISFSMLQALKKDLILEEDVKDVIEALINRDKEKLNSLLPISVDKKDLSKRAFLPWNIKKRNRINRMAEENADLIESVGEYEANPLKKIFKPVHKFLTSNKEETKMLKDGSEKQNSEEHKTEKKKLNEGEDIKLSAAYNILADKMHEISSKSNEEFWYKMYQEQVDKGNLSEIEATALEQNFNEYIKSIKFNTQENAAQNQEKKKTER